MIKMIVVTIGMAAVGMLVWRLLQAQEARHEARQQDEHESDES